MSKVYCGVDKVPKGKKRGTMKDCAIAGQIRYYGLKKIDSRLVEHAKSAKRGSAKLNTLIEQKAAIKGKINFITKSFKAEKDPAKKKQLNEQYKKLVVELKKLNAEIIKLTPARITSRKTRKGSKRRKSNKKSKRTKSRKSSRRTKSRKHSKRTRSRK